MIHPADMARIVRDHEAGFVANDNRPTRYPYDDEEGVSEWIRETRRSLLKWCGYALYWVVVAAGVVVAFNLGRGL